MQIDKNPAREFAHLYSLGRSAALDIHMDTGELRCACTRPTNPDAPIGQGMPPALYGGDWRRLAEFHKGRFLYA